MDLGGSQALVLSACVQMPSLPVIEEAEQRFGLPVISAATASAFELLNLLDIEPKIRDAGSLLRGF
jgi:maleate isomerase